MKCFRNSKSGICKRDGYMKSIQYVIPLIYNKETILAYIGWMFICVINSGLFVVNTIMMQRFLDSVMQNNFEKIMRNLFVLVASICCNLVFSGLSVWGDSLVEKKSMKALNIRLFNKVNKIDPWIMNKPEFWDELEKSKNGLEGAVYIVQTFFFMFSWHVPYFIFMCIYLYRVNPLFVGMLFLILIAILAIQKIKKKSLIRLEEEKASVQRRIDYYNRCIFGLDICKETKILNAVTFFKERYEREIERYNTVSRECGKKTVTIDLYGKMIITIVYIIVATVLMLNLISESITVGMFIAIFSSVERMFTMVRSVVASNLGFIIENISSVDFFVRFMCREEVERIPVEIDAQAGIKLSNVSFRYPQKKDYVLKNVNLEIKPQETIVIVGENGAGKSTLIDLIVGLYMPQKGRISYGIYKDEQARYYPINVSAVFQDFVKYKMNLRDNISMSNVRKSDLSDLKRNILFTDKSDQNLLKILEKVNFSDVNQNLSLDQMMSTEFGGIDVSGGVWQRIAVCRCLFKDGALLVLDEPTAAMDPAQESKIYEMYQEIAANKTTIIVSHRLGICKIADRVVVLKNGELCGIGSHEELLKKNQEYKRMWNAQASFYEV